MVWDCVSKLAETAYKKGIDSLVDEDLTDFFQGNIMNPFFKTGFYPSINLRKLCGDSVSFEEMMKPRRGKQWFYQDY